MKPSIDPAARAVEQVLDLMEREPLRWTISSVAWKRR
jgi:hypothetical protein